MNSPLNIGEKPMSKKIKISNLKPSHKICSPITPQTNLKNLFPKDFFEIQNNTIKVEQNELTLKKINSDNINENKSDEIFSKINPQNKENILFKISCKIDSSTNSHSTNNTESGNFNSKESNNKIEEIEDDIFKETPHFFPKVNQNKKEEENKIILSNDIKINNFDGEKVNKEIKNLFDNIPENLKSDPDVKEKVGILLKNIYEMKQIIHDKKEEMNSPSSKNNLRNNHIFERPFTSRKLSSKEHSIKGNSRYVKI